MIRRTLAALLVLPPLVGCGTLKNNKVGSDDKTEKGRVHVTCPGMERPSAADAADWQRRIGNGQR